VPVTFAGLARYNVANALAAAAAADALGIAAAAIGRGLRSFTLDSAVNPGRLNLFDLDGIRVPHTSRPPKLKKGVLTRTKRAAWRGPNSDDASGLVAMKAAGRVGHPLGKNPGDVWRLAASNYRGAHHATFPVALAERTIRAGCPEARCSVCGLPWRRPLHRATVADIGEVATRGALQATCTCDAPPEPGLVLDPFFGAGSTGVAAKQLGRDWLGIELNPAFAALAEQRITETPPAQSAHGPPA